MNNSARTDNGKITNSISARSDRFLRVIVTLLVLAFPAVVLFVNHGDSYTLGLLMLVGIWVWLRDGARVWMNKDSAALWLAFVMLFAVAVLAYVTGLQTDSGFHFLGRYLRFLLIVPVYLAFRRYPPTAKTVFIGLALGALTAGVLASLEFLHAHGPIRVTAQTDLSIIFGDLTTTMVLCTVAGFGLMAASRRRWSVPLLILCIAGGVAATLLSGTRGAWLPLLLLIPALATPAGGFLKHRYVFAILIAIIAVFSSSYFVTRTDTQVRLKDAVRNTVDYFIALHSLDAVNAGALSRMHCDNQKIFLDAWLKFRAADDESGLRAGVADDPLLGKAGICQGQYAIKLYNPGSVRWRRYIFPRMRSYQAGRYPIKLLVRGEGIFIFGKEKQAQMRIATQDYKQIVLKTGNWPGILIIVYVPPKQALWLVPLGGYFGEYSLSIAETSVGKRFEMWRAAWQLFLQHPFLGVGTGAYQAKTNELIHIGQVAPFIGVYDHPHNDYLDALSSRGILGFATLLAVLLIPAGRCLRATRSPERARHAIGLAGVLTVTSFAIYALTDTIFLHSIMITWYVIYMALFYARLDANAAPYTNSKRIQ
ncbi:MAG TPA: O-antigen ligase family protein [Gammaproteobacteria bacterium]|nr:O-antigen ligase family protein [Gammaproteobacteria bacterium]